MTNTQKQLLENWEKDFKKIFYAIKQAIKRDSTHLEQSGADDWFIEKVKKIQEAQDAKTREECGKELDNILRIKSEDEKKLFHANLQAMHEYEMRLRELETKVREECAGITENLKRKEVVDSDIQPSNQNNNR